jgi:hypothetical protein
MLICAGLAEAALARPGEGLDLQAQGQPVQRTTSRPAIELRRNLLSVRLHNIPWETVLNEIQHQTGIMIQVEGRIAGTLTQEFQDLPLEKGLRTLFRDTNLAFFYAAGTIEDTSAATLTRVWLFPKQGMTAEEGRGHRSTPGLSAEQPDDRGAPNEMSETTPPEDEATPEGELVAEHDQERSLEALDGPTPYGNELTVEQLGSQSDQGIQATALELIEPRDPQDATTVLVSALTSEEPAARLQALDLLYQSGQADDKIVLSALSEALNDEDMAVKGYAIQALAERGGPGAIEPLRQTLHNPDPSIRLMVLASIVYNSQSRPLLEEAVLDADPEVRSFAAFWLEQAMSEGR